MTETQAHGFTWEKDLIQHVYGATDAIGYTNKIDLPASLNRLDHVDVSIKTTGTKHAVCLGDCLRFYDSVSSDSSGYQVQQSTEPPPVFVQSFPDLSGRTPSTNRRD